MAYVPAWERLSDALNRIMAESELSEEAARAELCRAIADRAIKLRAQLAEHPTRHVRASDTVLASEHFQIPANLKPQDLDWERSRPVQPWLVPRGEYAVHGHWHMHWIEVCRADLSRAFCLQDAGAAARHTVRKAAARDKGRPARERAQHAIHSLYPGGVPPQAMLPNAILCRSIGRWLKQERLPDVSSDTILRAAGRRK